MDTLCLAPERDHCLDSGLSAEAEVEETILNARVPSKTIVYIIMDSILPLL